MSSSVETFHYDQHPRVEERKQQGPTTVRKVIGKRTSDRAIARFNSRIGLGITTSVGTMWCAYAFTILAFVSLPAAIASHSPIVIVGWIAQTFLQLVLLPVIIVGQNIQAAAADERSAATYEDATAILEESKQIQLHLATQDTALSTLLDKILALEKVIQARAK